MNKFDFSCSKKAIYNYSVVKQYYSNVWIIFSHQNLTKYWIKYHYPEPNYSNIQIIGTICSNSEVLTLIVNYSKDQNYESPFIQSSNLFMIISLSHIDNLASFMLLESKNLEFKNFFNFSVYFSFFAGKLGQFSICNASQ